MNEALSSRAADVGAAEAADVPALTEQTVLKVEQLSRETGWLLITVGVVGVVVPGVPGMPFLLAGAMVLTPGGSKLLSRWAGQNPPKFVRSAMRQIGRFLDDLERRYPRTRPPRLENKTNRTLETR
jgi:hypothetical protein